MPPSDDPPLSSTPRPSDYQPGHAERRSVDRLLAAICGYCGLPIRDHCRYVELVWIFTPCRRHIVAQLSPEMRSAFTANGVCQLCHKEVERHVELWTPQLSVTLSGPPTTVIAGGRLIARLVYRVIDCRQEPLS